MATGPRRGVFAQQVQTQLASPDTSYQSIAAGLADFSPALKALGNMQAEKQNSEQTTLGTEAALQSALTYRDAVKAGKVQVGDNPFFRQAYKEQLGRNTGLQVEADLNTAYTQWDGKDSDDPAALRDFMGSFLKERTADISDPDVLNGIQPQLKQGLQNLTTKHSAYTTARIEQGYKDQTGIAIGNALHELQPTSGTDAGQAFWNHVEDMKGEAKLTGFPLKDFDKMTVDAIRAYAYETLDASALDLLNDPRAGGVPSIGSKPEVQKQIADDRSEIAQRSYYADQARARTEREGAATSTEAWRSKLLEDGIASGTGHPSPALVVQMLRELGTDAGQKILSDQKSIATDIAPTEVYASDADERLANEMAVIRGDVKGVQQMIFDGRIPRSKWNSLLTQARNQEQAIKTHDRSDTTFEQGQMDRDIRLKDKQTKQDKVAEEQQSYKDLANATHVWPKPAQMQAARAALEAAIKAEGGDGKIARLRFNQSFGTRMAEFLVPPAGPATP